MKRSRVMLAALGVALSSGGAAAQAERDLRTTTTSRQRVGEEDLTIEVKFGLGEFRLSRDQSGALYSTRLLYDDDLFDEIHSYDRDRRKLSVELSGENRNFNLRNLQDLGQELHIAISPAVPTRLDLELGVVKADIDLGGMSLQSVEIKTGASESTIRFSRPTVAPCELLSVTLGAAEFAAEELGNSNCARVNFEGAAGSFALDFTGEWQHQDTMSARIKLGVGSLNLRFPERLGVAISLDRFLTSFDRPGFVKRGDRYYSANYDSAASKLSLDINAAFGDIDIEWVRER